MVLITEVLALLAMPVVGGYRRGWGLASALTHHLMIPLLLLAVAISIGMPTQPAARGATGLSLVVIVLAGLVLAIERLRQWLPRAYLPITLLVIAALAASGVPLRRLASDESPLGTTIILLALGISIVLGHLAFLDAYALLITPGGLDHAELHRRADRRDLSRTPARHLLDSPTCRRTSCSGLG